MKKHLILTALIISSTVFNASFAMDNAKAKAKKGEIRAMMDVMVEQAKECSISKDEESCRKATIWFLRTVNRLCQDAFCVTDTSIKKQYKSIILSMLEERVSDDSFNEQIMMEAFKWVEKRTIDDTLPPPLGINETNKKSFFPQDEWKARRQKVLDELYKKL